MKKYSLFNIRHSKRGFTLVELSLFMGLFSIILLVLTTIFAELIQKQLEIQSMSAVESDKNYIISRLEYDIGRANTITLPIALGDTSSQLDLQIDNNTYTYKLDGTNLEVVDSVEEFQLNNERTKISNISFQKIGNSGGTPTIRVYMDIISAVSEGSRTRSTTIDTTYGIR